VYSQLLGTYFKRKQQLQRAHVFAKFWFHLRVIGWSVCYTLSTDLLICRSRCAIGRWFALRSRLSALRCR